VNCFYDADEEIDLWGKYLAEELPAIYAERAATVGAATSTNCVRAARRRARHHQADAPAPLR
jgi:hypothetical protein